MAEQIPLVLVAGELQQLPSGDTLAGAGGDATVFGTYSLSTADNLDVDVEEQIQFDTEDRAAAFGTLATATGVVTISEAGTYTVKWAVHVTNGSATETTIHTGVKVNGSKVVPETTKYQTYTWAHTINCSIDVDIDVDDTIEIYYLYDTAGGTDNISIAGKWTWMQILQNKNGVGPAGPTGPTGADYYDVGSGFSDTPTTAQVLEKIMIGRALTLPADFAGAVGNIDTNPTATFAIDVQDDAVSIGTISISTGGVFTFTTVSGTSKVVAAGSVLSFHGPGTVDTTAADAIWTLLGSTV